MQSAKCRIVTRFVVIGSAFVDNNAPVPAVSRISRGCFNTATGRDTGYDDGVHAHVRKNLLEVGAVERSPGRLANDRVLGARSDFIKNAVARTPRPVDIRHSAPRLDVPYVLLQGRRYIS